MKVLGKFYRPLHGPYSLGEGPLHGPCIVAPAWAVHRAAGGTGNSLHDQNPAHRYHTITPYVCRFWIGYLLSEICKFRNHRNDAGLSLRASKIAHAYLCRQSTQDSHQLPDRSLFVTLVVGLESK